MSVQKCECCGEAPGRTYLALIGHVCDECVVFLGRAHLVLSEAVLGLAGCAEKPNQESYEH